MAGDVASGADGGTVPRSQPTRGGDRFARAGASDRVIVVLGYLEFGEDGSHGISESLSGAADIVRNGHERFDGAGCPRGLEGAATPLESRILFVCDAFEAMLSERAYRSVISEEAALDQLRRGAGSQFDPDVVDAFCAEHRHSRRRPGHPPAARLRPPPADREAPALAEASP